MAIFKILESAPRIYPDPTSKPTFKIELLEGEVSIGSRFVLWETRHQVNIEVFDVRNVAGTIQLKLIQVDSVIPCEKAWEGAIVDTENKLRSRRHGYSV